MKMAWYWYVAGERELFIDIDRYKQSIKHIRRRLQGAHESNALSIDSVFLFPSSENHAHMIITTNTTIPPIERYVWEMLFHSDIYRTAANIMRYSRNISAPDILINRDVLHRPPDAVCYCNEKHTRNIMGKCLIASGLRGKDGATAVFFGKPSSNPCNFLQERTDLAE